MDMVRERELNVPIFQKQNLTIEEAAVYSNIGQHKLRELTADERCPFVLWVGNKRLIKRRQFDEYMSRAYSVRKADGRQNFERRVLLWQKGAETAKALC